MDTSTEVLYIYYEYIIMNINLYYILIKLLIQANGKIIKEKVKVNTDLPMGTSTEVFNIYYDYIIMNINLYYIYFINI